tara:strand:+ start:3423 stop:4145 length:723 start_codon:yes stop_codon:yes gene_type:complete
MSKRFTETTKWDGSWFRLLSPRRKCLWLFLADRCDQAGVIERDLALFSFFVGDSITDKDVGALAENVRVIANGKLWLPKFVRFQYGNLSRDCLPHRPVFAAMDKHGLCEADFAEPSRVSIAQSAADDGKEPPELIPFAADAKQADEIYSAYPRKTGRVPALRAITAALQKEEFTTLLAATKAFAIATSLWPEEERTFIAHPATWFNRESYADDQATWARTRKAGNNRVGGMKGADHANGF